MEEKTFRNHVSWVMFLFSVLVIWGHSYNTELFAGTYTGPLWDSIAGIQTFLSMEVSPVAVPGFFMLSAYLFFRNFTWEKLPGKWKGRFFSVAVPYIAWNLLYYLGYLLATRLPVVRQVVGKEPVPFGGREILGAIFRYQYAPIFWYLYQLIILIVLSPLIYVLIKNRIVGLVWLAVLAAAVHFGLDTQNPNTDALFYYSFAAWMALHGRQMAEAAYGKQRLLAGGMALAAAVFCFIQKGRPGADVLWIVSYRLLAPVALWLLLDGRRTGQTRPWMRQSMFQYAIHFVVVRLVNKGSAMALGHVLGEYGMAAASVVLYLALPAVVVAVSYGAALILGRYLPAVWRLLSGGRSL